MFSTELHTGEGGYRQTPADSCLHSEHREVADNVPVPTNLFIAHVKSVDTPLSYKQRDMENVRTSSMDGRTLVIKSSLMACQLSYLFMIKFISANLLSLLVKN